MSAPENNQDIGLAERMTRNEWEIGEMRSAVGEIRDAIKTISSAIVNIALLDQRHDSAVESLNKEIDAREALSKRVTAIELALPILTLTSNWVRAGVIGIVSLVLMAGARLLLGH